MNGRSAFVLSQATQLIAAGGHYQHMALTDVVGEILGELGALDAYFEFEEEPPYGGTVQ